MSRSMSSTVKRVVPSAALAVALTAGAAVLSVTSTARGASDRKQAAAIELTQTCTSRIKARARIDIQAVLTNTGDQILTSIAIGADAGTPNDEGDDFVPQLQRGDTNGNGVLDPGERWTYGGGFTAPDHDVTNVVDVDAVAPGDIAVNDLAECETDIIETPQPGVIVGAQPLSGRVLVQEPGTSKFVELKGMTEIPVGSVVDTTRGVINLTSGLGGGRTNSSQFYSGVFKLLQKKTRNALMTLRMQGGNFRRLRPAIAQHVRAPKRDESGRCGACGATARGASRRAGATARPRCAARSGSPRTGATVRSRASCAASSASGTSAGGRTSPSGPARATWPRPPGSRGSSAPRTPRRSRPRSTRSSPAAGVPGPRTRR